MATKNKEYIIVGDNNFWYSTFSAKTAKEARKELARVRREIEKGVGSEFDEPSEASVLYLYQASQLAECSIKN